MRIKPLDLIGVMFFAVLGLGWALIPDRPLILGIILAVPLVFFLPGYTLTQVLFRKRSPDQASDSSSNLILQPRLKIGQPVGAVDHFIFSLGLSMAIDVVIGFILNAFPMGLQLRSWAISLGLITMVFALLAAYFRRRDFVRIQRLRKFRITIYECTMFGLSIVVATVAVWFSIIRPPQPQPSFTEFWMLPQSSKSCAVIVGLHSYESTPVTYRVVVTINGTQTTSWSSILLATQQAWNRLLPITSATARSVSVEAQLYRSDKPGTIYREVHVTLPHCSTAGAAITSFPHSDITYIGRVANSERFAEMTSINGKSGEEIT